MELYSVFVTGANRGIGLEFVRQFVGLSKPPKYIFATYRSRDGIQALEEIRDASKKTQVLLIKMDITKTNEIVAAKKIIEDLVGNKGLTLLINNAAVNARQGFPNITEENLIYHFKANTVGPIMVTQEFLPLLQKSAANQRQDSKLEVSRSAVLNISAALGSITLVGDLLNNATSKAASYIISKTALNMAARIIAANVKSQGILVVNMCPGWVKTDMGSEYAELDVKDSVSAMMKTLSSLNEAHQGQFMDRHGKLYEF